MLFLCTLKHLWCLFYFKLPCICYSCLLFFEDARSLARKPLWPVASANIRLVFIRNRLRAVAFSVLMQSRKYNLGSHWSSAPLRHYFLKMLTSRIRSIFFSGSVLERHSRIAYASVAALDSIAIHVIYPYSTILLVPNSPWHS